MSCMIIPDAGVAASQSFSKVEFFLTGAAAGTKAVLSAKQASAGGRVYLMVGDGSIDLTDAEAEALVKRPDGSDLSVKEINAKLLLKAVFTNIAAAADGAKCIAFAVGGIGASDVIRAELTVTSAGTSAAQTSRIVASMAACRNIRESDLTSVPALGASDIGLATVAGVAFGFLAPVDVADVPAASEAVKLVLYIKN